MNYLQKKKQAIIMMLAAQIIKTAKGYPVTVNDCESGVAVDYTVFGNTVTGKNLFDTQGWYNWLRTFTTTYVTKTEVDGVSCIFYRPNVTYDKQYMKGQFKENTQYTISFRAKGIVGTGVSTGFKFVHTDGTYNIKAVANKVEWDSYTLVSSANKTVDHIEMVYNYAQGCYFDENSIQLEEGAATTEYEPYSESYAGDKTKNLIPYPYYESTKTVNGITFTDNGDGTITVSGTPTASISYYLGQVDVKPGEKYRLSGMDVGKNLAFILTGHSADGTKLSQQNSRSISYTAEDNAAYVKIWIDRIKSNVEIPTNIVKPQLELGTTATEYEPYGYKIPIVNSSKNLIPPMPEATFAGVTLSKIDDYYVLNGTCTQSYNYVPFNISIPKGTYTISANNPVTLNLSTAIIQLYNASLDETLTAYDLKISSTQTKAMTGGKYQFRIRVQKNVTYENFIIKPQLELSTTATEYEPYRASSTASIYLDEPLKHGESVNFGADNLPELQLFEGSNIITADTEIKPEKIVIDYYEKG